MGTDLCILSHWHDWNSGRSKRSVHSNTISRFCQCLGVDYGCGNNASVLLLKSVRLVFVCEDSNFLSKDLVVMLTLWSFLPSRFNCISLCVRTTPSRMPTLTVTSGPSLDFILVLPTRRRCAVWDGLSNDRGGDQCKGCVVRCDGVRPAVENGNMEGKAFFIPRCLKFRW